MRLQHGDLLALVALALVAAVVGGIFKDIDSLGE
jgi:hypothetical protein